MGRVDFNVSAKHKFFVNARYNNRSGLRGNRLGYDLNHVTSVIGLVRTNYGATVDDVYTINPTTVLNTRANWTRFEEP